MSNMKMLRLRFGIVLVLLFCFGFASAYGERPTGVNVSVGSILLLKKTDRFGALVPREINIVTSRVAFDWYYFPIAEQAPEDPIQSGHNIVYLEKGQAPISFAHFTLVIQEGPGGQILVRSANKPGLYSQNIFFCFPHVSHVEDIQISEEGFNFALLPGPPRDVPFDEEKASLVTPKPKDSFYPANETVISATDPEFRWPASKDAESYHVQVAVIRPGLLSDQHFLIAEARRVQGTSIRLSEMSPVQYDTDAIPPAVDVDGILAENAPDPLLKSYSGPRQKPGPLLSDHLYGWKVIPDKEDDLKINFGWTSNTLYNLWFQFTVKNAD